VDARVRVLFETARLALAEEAAPQRVGHAERERVPSAESRGEEPCRGKASAARLSGTFAPAVLLCAACPLVIVNRMVQYVSARLDASFAALSDATRRGVLDQLGRADASISDLAEKFNMTLTGMKKHVGVLEQAGLVSTEKVGRVRTCRLGPCRLEEETAWIERYRQLWAARFDELDVVVDELKQKEKLNGRKKR
jgi:DNA-binding transcriptional ArsR family regulator